MAFDSISCFINFGNLFEDIVAIGFVVCQFSNVCIAEERRFSNQKNSSVSNWLTLRLVRGHQHDGDDDANDDDAECPALIAFVHNS